MKLAHIIHALEIQPRHIPSYLHVAQPVTIASMFQAKQHVQGTVDVDLICVAHKDEHFETPPGFSRAPDLQRWCTDVFKQLPQDKPLALISDILNSLFDTSDAEWFVYTNVDIGLFPDFYHRVNSMIVDGDLDSLIINRLDMPKHINDVKIDHTNYQLVFDHPGEVHPGCDCFVFRREFIHEMVLGDVFVGTPPIGSVLRNELNRLSGKHSVVTSDKRLTFHLGRDVAWRAGKANPLWLQNNEAARCAGHHAGLWGPC